jgi:hypothetical protein
MTAATGAGEFYERLYELATQFAADATNAATDGSTTMATRGPVPISYASDIITMGDISAAQVPATIARGRDETISVGMTFSTFRTGESDAAMKDAKDAAFALTNSVATYLRSALTGDTRLGGTVEWSFLTDLQAMSAEISQPAGFLWEVDANFQALFRVRG